MTNKISNKIRYYRFINNEMTQKELADRVGVSRQTIIAIKLLGRLINHSRLCLLTLLHNLMTTHCLNKDRSI